MAQPGRSQTAPTERPDWPPHLTVVSAAGLTSGRLWAVGMPRSGVPPGSNQAGFRGKALDAAIQSSAQAADLLKAIETFRGWDGSETMRLGGCLGENCIAARWRGARLTPQQVN